MFLDGTIRSYNKYANNIFAINKKLGKYIALEKNEFLMYVCFCFEMLRFPLVFPLASITFHVYIYRILFLNKAIKRHIKKLQVDLNEV